MRLRPGMRAERLGDEVVLLDVDSNVVLRLVGDPAEVVQRLDGGERHLPRRLHRAADQLADAGVLTPSGLSRRRILQLGAAGAIAGVTVLALPTAAAAQSPSCANSASGGVEQTYTFNSMTYRSHAFTTVGAFSLQLLVSSLTVDVLVLGGGGGGGGTVPVGDFCGAGGGGAGEVLVQSGITLTADSDVTVGGGGDGATSVDTTTPSDNNGVNGDDSEFLANGSTSYLAEGGGGGGGGGRDPGDSSNRNFGSPGLAGGCGGGGCGSGNAGGAPNLGFRGGNGITNRGSGGGGMGAAGADGASARFGTNGGDGDSYLGWGSALLSVVAGGGGGGGYSDLGTPGNGGPGLGGSGGGGNGGWISSGSPQAPVAGTATSGGGGGGAGRNTPFDGAPGGSGIVIVRYVCVEP